MKTNLVLFVALFTFLLTACKKDKFTTKPQVSAKSITPGTVVRGDIISMRSAFTDEEGDIDSIYVVVKWYAGDIGTKMFDTLRYSTADYNLPPKVRDGDIFVKFTYGISSTNPPQMPFTPVTKDTNITIGILAIDKEKNRSDYTESDKIRLIKP